jgi:hypothetical protein
MSTKNLVLSAIKHKQRQAKYYASEKGKKARREANSRYYDNVKRKHKELEKLEKQEQEAARLAVMYELLPELADTAQAAPVPDISVSNIPAPQEPASKQDDAKGDSVTKNEMTMERFFDRLAALLPIKESGICIHPGCDQVAPAVGKRKRKYCGEEHRASFRAIMERMKHNVRVIQCPAMFRTYFFLWLLSIMEG